MTTVTISAKVPLEMAKRISQTNFKVSDLIHVSLDIFLNMNKDEQDNYMLKYMHVKKLNRALARYPDQRKQTSHSNKENSKH